MNKLKALLLAAAFALTGCSTTTPAFMDKAVVINVDDNRTLVAFPTSRGYRPQFASDCPPILLGEERPSTGGCYISTDRVNWQESYAEHKAHGAHAAGKKTIISNHHNYANDQISTTDNL